jgi:peptide chain release factor subunit 1
VVDSSPYIRPLARILDEWESFSLVLISTNYAKIFSVDFGQVKDEKSLSKDVINKHKKGGWSQARFNRIRKGQIHDFLNEVADALQKRDDEQIIIAGPGVTKNQFIEMLPQNISKKIVDVVDISIDDEKEILKKSIYIISEKEDRKSHEAVDLLKQEILKDGLAVYGIKDTFYALKSGQVELLIIQKDIKIKGWLCEKCQVVEKGIKSRCPYCSNTTSRVDIFEELLEFAERTDAEVEFTDDEEIANLGHIGAILRYK